VTAPNPTDLPRVLVTGPVLNLAEYAEAARKAGWDPLAHPLLAVETLPFERAALGSGPYEWIAVTSANALVWLRDAIAAVPELALLPTLAVGSHTAARVRALGLTLDGGPHSNSGELAAALVAKAAKGARVLWPRGDVSDDLAVELRVGGLAVVDPVGYRTRSIARGTAPGAHAVFFASPSAVRAWKDLEPSGEGRRTAVAIGGTTFAALHEKTAPAFFDTIKLPEPTPAAFAFVLAHLDVKRTP
jgi:uroporphyrinogen-III synthase